MYILTLSCYIFLSLPTDPFPSSFSVNVMYACLVLPTRVTSPNLRSLSQATLVFWRLQFHPTLYQKDDRAKSGKLRTKKWPFSLPAINCLSYFSRLFTFTYSSARFYTPLSLRVTWCKYTKLHSISLQNTVKLRGKYTTRNQTILITNCGLSRGAWSNCGS